MGDTGAKGDRGEKASSILVWGIAIAASLLAVLTYAQVERIDGLAEDICVGQNEVRSIIRHNLQTELSDLDEADRSLFPDIPKEEFDRLVEAQRVQLEGQIDNVSPIRCVE
jgi:hypothetical protein